MTIKSPKKLIEVALPLDDINVAAAREKSIRHGRPSTLHLWWARRPLALAAARAVLFAQLVNDPDYERGLGCSVNKKDAAKGTNLSGVVEAGVLESGKGVVRLLRYAEYPTDWSPENDKRTPVWEALHHLIRALQTGGESASGALLAKMPTRTESIRQLAYRLYTLCERKGWAEEARVYNELITSWQAIEIAAPKPEQVESQIELDL
jgi:adenine-specific DNA methylase